MLANSTSPKPKRHSVLLQLSYSGPTQPIPKKSLQIRTDKPRPHVCAICTRGFARLEHLKRHERSHTNEKPFQCAACGRCFARRDLVLRHQHKLHLHVSPIVRRGLLPLTLPAPDSAAGTPSSDNIIVLNNNTSAKAPLPKGLQGLSPATLHSMMDLATLSPSNASPREFMANSLAQKQALGYRASVSYPPQLNGAIPSPNTNSNHNTPSGNIRKPLARSATADLDPLQLIHAGFTQQPSPLTGDSPDLKEKRKLISFWPPQHSIGTNHATDNTRSASEAHLMFTRQAHLNEHPRHMSFSAVSGASYTNIKDALTLQNNLFLDAPTQVGFATPQLTAAEQDSKGLTMDDFNSLDLDWYNLDFNNKDKNLGEFNGNQNSQSRLFRSDSGTGFKMKLNTIPSVSRIASKTDVTEGNYFASGIMSAHHFQDPNHPHHIKGTTPIDFSFSPVPEISNSLGPDSLSGTGMLQLAQDMFDLEKAPPVKTTPETKPAAAKATKAAKSKAAPLKHKASSVNLKDLKRTKLGFVNEVDDLTWVEQIKGVPVVSEFPTASHETGFNSMPYMNDQFESDEVFSLFKFRQDDLVRQRSQVNTNAMQSASPNGSEMLNSSLTQRASKVKFTIGEQHDFITEELRNRIIAVSNLSDLQFPPLDDLNTYMNLYEKEFNSYFLFIHMPTLKNPVVDNFENIPLILSMCAIGALYSYHDSNTLLLFNLSKFHIHNFFEKEVTVDKLQFKKVPIMAHQSLVLHIFISMFLNEPNMIEVTSRQMNLMVGLIKSTNFHKPLEQFLVPPPSVSNPNDLAVMQNNFDYFIMTQTRIRTVHTFYQLEVFRSALLGCPLPMSGSDIQCGTHCNDEELWKAGNAREWYMHSLTANSKTLVELSNNESMHNLFEQLNNASFSDTKMTLNKSFALLMHVHEQILVEQIAQNQDTNGNALSWRVNHRPKLENLLKSWESHFVRNGGFSVVNNHNHHTLNSRSELKLILPLLSFAKIRLCLNFTPTMEKVLYKDWKGMEETLNEVEADFEALKEATQHATDILNLWVHNISVLSNAKQTSVRTPVFFVSCVFIAFLVIAKTLAVIERTEKMSVHDRALWLHCESVLRSIEATLNPMEESNTYSEFLRRHSQGVFDYAWSPDFKRKLQQTVAGLNSGKDEDASMRSALLSIHALSLGIRTLADAPLWPLAMGFAEALKNMAVQTNQP